MTSEETEAKALRSRLYSSELCLAPLDPSEERWKRVAEAVLALRGETP
jgi:hypothetical protein